MPRKEAKTAGGKKNQKRASGEEGSAEEPGKCLRRIKTLALTILAKRCRTTIRELVENSLDAAESIQVLPSIQVEVTELSQKSFDAFRGAKNVHGKICHFTTKIPAGGRRCTTQKVDGVGISVDASLTPRALRSRRI